MELKLPNSLYSREQLEAVLFELAEYLDWSRSASIKAKVTGSEGGNQERIWSTDIQSVLEASGKGMTPTVADVEELIAQLGAFKDSAPNIHVTLAGWPSANLRAELVGWFRTNLDPQLLVSFGVNRNLIGGLAVRVGSHMFDYSWRKTLIAKRDLIPEIIRRV